MYDDNEQEPVDELFAAQPAFEFPCQLFTDEDAEDNSSYVRGYN